MSERCSCGHLNETCTRPEGDPSGRAVQDGLDPERLARAYAEFVRQGGDWPKWDEIDDFDKDGLRSEAQEIADRYRAAPPSKPVIGEVGEK